MKTGWAEKTSMMRGASLGAIAIAASLGAMASAQAAPVTFTWDPGSVVAAQPQFTANKINLLDFGRIDLGATVGGLTAFSESGYLQVNNFSLANATVNPSGLGTNYTLYLQYTGAGLQSGATFNGGSTGVYTSLNFSLIEAVGASSFGISGGNATVTNVGGTTTLATGSLLTGSTAFQSAPVGASANILTTFGETLAAFFVNPPSIVQLDLHGAFNNNDQIITVSQDGQHITLDGGGGDITFTAVPEPMTLALLGGGLVTIGALRRRRG